MALTKTLSPEEIDRTVLDIGELIIEARKESAIKTVYQLHAYSTKILNWLLEGYYLDTDEYSLYRDYLRELTLRSPKLRKEGTA